MLPRMRALPTGRAFFMYIIGVCCSVSAMNGTVEAREQCAMTPEKAVRLGEEFGLIVGEVDEEIQKELGLVKPQGVAIFEVIGGTPADLAGIKVRAIMKEIDKIEIRTMEDFGCALIKTKDVCGFTVGTYEPASPETQGVGGAINFHLVRCLRD